MFMGEYNHTIDAKGRLIIPAKFREALGDEFVVTKGMDGCLFAYDEAGWTNMVQRLQKLDLNQKNHRTYVRHLLAGAATVEVDKQGRILLPANLREFAALDKDVLLAGVGSRVEIWNKEKWQTMMQEEEATIEEISEQLGDFTLPI